MMMLFNETTKQPNVAGRTFELDLDKMTLRAASAGPDRALDPFLAMGVMSSMCLATS